MGGIILSDDDVVGYRSGKLTIVYSYRERENGVLQRKCIAICKCGNVVNLKLQSVLQRRTKSCGCIRASVDPAIKVEYNAYRFGAKKREYDFNITLDEFSKITKLNCHYCGSEPKEKEFYSSNKLRQVYLFNGIDRKDNKIGYIMSNCVPCCKICNYAKHSLSYADFKEWINKLVMFNG